MTFERRSTKVNKTYIEIYQEKYQAGYTVVACQDLGYYIDRPFIKNYYGTWKQANRRFRDLVKMAKDGKI